ncbi:MAG: glycosyltransferase family 2 protein [Rothia sp. (in: high G+C Gram-positive bacteria)]|nr:glycosyltransferase family 2 protein [Rothia sp. (in: high G+C Gram-positive bacteria)]
MPSVAIIIRTKDRPLFLRRALKNIAEQTFSDYSVVVVNDGGDRAQVEEIIAAAQGINPVKTIHHNQPQGMEAASNAAIRATESTYIAIHDDDDLWEPEFLAATVAELESTGEQMVAVRTDEYFEKVTDQGTFEFISSRPFWANLNDITVQDLTRINRAVPISLLYRRSLHDELGLYDPNLPVVGDWEFNLRVASRYRIVFINRLLAHWSQRPDAHGSAANSVHAGKVLHEMYDGRVRAQAIRDDLARNENLGAYLFGAHLANQVDGSVGHNIDLTHRVLEELNAIKVKLDQLENTTRLTSERLDRVEKALSLKVRLQRFLKGTRS